MILTHTKEFQIAWASGILEGEGCFSIFKRSTGRKTFSLAIHCEMSDEDVIKTLKSVFNVGTICLRDPKLRKDNCIRKPTWIWSVQKREDIKAVLNLISPYMHTRRSDKIKLILQILNGS